MPTSRDPRGTWCTCAESPDSVVGVAFGIGDTQCGFVPEGAIDAFLATGDDGSEESRTFLPLIQRAREGLVEFKRILKAAQKAKEN